MSEPLPIYPEFRLKAELIARQMSGGDTFDQAMLSLVMGGIIRTWLHAAQRGVGPDFFTHGLTAEQIDQAVGVRGLAQAMVAKGWLAFGERRVGKNRSPGASFPGLKQFKKERAKADWDATVNAAGATAKLAWFEGFWEAYRPAEGNVKGSKREAQAEWLRIKGLDDALATEIVEALKREVRSGWKVCNGKTPHARRYLHGRMWEEAPAPRPMSRTAPPASDRPPAGPSGPGGAPTQPEANAEPQGPAPSIAAKVGLKRGRGTPDTTGPTPPAEQGGRAGGPGGDAA